MLFNAHRCKLILFTNNREVIRWRAVGYQDIMCKKRHVELS